MVYTRSKADHQIVSGGNSGIAIDLLDKVQCEYLKSGTEVLIINEL